MIAIETPVESVAELPVVVSEESPVENPTATPQDLPNNIPEVQPSVEEVATSKPSLADVQSVSVNAEEKKSDFVLPSLADLLPAALMPSIVGPGTISSVDTGTILSG